MGLRSLLTAGCGNDQHRDSMVKKQIKQWIAHFVDEVGFYKNRSGELRCLMYHSIVPESIDDAGQMTTPVALFREQMDFLAHHGYHVEEIGSVLRRLRAGDAIPANTILLTFDDGFADCFQLAFPILRHYQFPATVFLIAAALDGSKERLGNAWDAEYLTWDQVHEMRASGLIQFGCHGATHLNLRGLPHLVLRNEIEGAKRCLEEGLGESIDAFAYPYGSYGSWDLVARRAVEQAGFEGAFTSVSGVITTSSDRFLLRRSRVSWCDQVPEFGRLLNGAYDWTSLVQLLQAPRTRRLGADNHQNDRIST